MKIGIDARFITHPQAGGFKTYTKGLVGALAEVDADNQYILYLDRAPAEAGVLPNRANFRFRVVPGSAPMVGMPWREQIGLARQATVDRLDIFHAPCLTGPLWLHCPSVVTIHDMIWYFSEQVSNGGPRSRKRKLMEFYYRNVPKFAARRAGAVITVSNAAKASIVQHLHIPVGQIYVTHEAASHLYRPIDDPTQLTAIRQQYRLPPGFVLAIGSADPRKNLSSLVQAYALLPISLQERHHLAVVWTHRFLEAELTNEIETLGIKERVHFLERVNDEDLVLLYNAAALFVFPSRYEGFGLPLLEAMACGTPVVAADNSSIPEVAGEAALLVSADDVGAIAQAIRRGLTESNLRRCLRDKGLQRAACFSWTKCGLETIEVYKRLGLRPMI
jgi:glycosyltransferase involved in cell wall biosynthesis